MLKVLFLIYIFFSLAKTQEVSKLPDFNIDETFMNVGPSTIHSIKGKFYEETQREIAAKPKNYSENVTKLNPEANIASQLHSIISNISNMDIPNHREKIIFRRDKSNSNNTKESIPEDISNSKPLKAYNFTENIETTHENNSDSSMLFQAEKVVTDYDKNNTVETIKKELAFDSLLIRNDFNKLTNMLPANLMNSYSNREFDPETDIAQQPVMMQVNQPYRRLETSSDYEPIISNAFQMTMPDNNFTPHINLSPNHFNIAPSLPIRQTNMPINDENNDIPITPKFQPTNYGNKLPNNMNIDSMLPLRQNNYNVIDKSTCEDKESDEILERSGNDIQLKEPTKGIGISNVGKSRVMLMDHPRVCYACSSINDPSCWSPDRKTAVKYCRADHPSCITKLYRYKGLSYIIRDCGDTCEQNALAGGPTKYTSCTICHHDLCNSSSHFEIQNFTFLVLLSFHLFFCIESFIN